MVCGLHRLSLHIAWDVIVGLSLFQEFFPHTSSWIVVSGLPRDSPIAIEFGLRLVQKLFQILGMSFLIRGSPRNSSAGLEC